MTQRNKHLHHQFIILSKKDESLGKSHLYFTPIRVLFPFSKVVDHAAPAVVAAAAVLAVEWVVAAEAASVVAAADSVPEVVSAAAVVAADLVEEVSRGVCGFSFEDIASYESSLIP